MNWPPMLLHLRIPREKGYCGLWLPWFLIYPVLLVLMIIVLPLVILLAIFMLPTGKARLLILSGPYLWQVLFNMRGLRVHLYEGKREIMFNFV
jgi:hypothetical protein